MFAYTSKNIKLVIVLMLLCFLSCFIQIFYYDPHAAPGKTNPVVYISVIQFLIYCYNLIIFKKFLETELENRSMNFIISAITVFFAFNIVFTITAPGLSPGLQAIGGFIILIGNMLSFVFVIKLFRLETEQYKIELNLIALSLLVSTLLSYLTQILYYAMPEYAYLIRWLMVFFLVPDLAYAFLYSKLLTKLKAKNYTKPEERFTIGE